jgi:maltooligosyltrehalose synthase
LADSVVAFARRNGDDVAITVVPRIASHLLRPGDIAFESGAWKGTALVDVAAQPLASLFDGQMFDANAPITIDSLLGRVPFAVLIRSGMLAR